MTTSEWAELLAATFRGTKYDADAASYWGWCSAGVGTDDDPESVLEAWIEQCDGEGRPAAQEQLAELRAAKDRTPRAG